VRADPAKAMKWENLSTITTGGKPCIDAWDLRQQRGSRERDCCCYFLPQPLAENPENAEADIGTSDDREDSVRWPRRLPHFVETPTTNGDERSGYECAFHASV
jgi:hypothetical protein